MTNVHKRGFTLIELMIILAIVGILVALALPSFRDTIRKSRRSDAMNAIMDIHLEQERFRVNNTTYGSLTDLGATDPLISPDGHYSLTVTGNNATNYTITAAVKTGDDQTNDACGSFTLAFAAGTITKTAGGDDALCWKK